MALYWRQGWQVVKSLSLARANNSETAITWSSSTPPFQMKYNLFCFLIGERRTFLVPMDRAECVGTLKDEIKARHQALNDIKSCDLILYLAEIDHPLDMQERLNKLTQLSRNLDECRALDDDEQGVQVIFGENVQGKYIIVQIPDGESFNLRACGEVASSLWPR